MEILCNSFFVEKIKNNKENRVLKCNAFSTLFLIYHCNIDTSVRNEIRNSIYFVGCTIV